MVKQLSSREFRAAWTSLTGEVVAVTAHGRVLGHWVPGDNPLKWSDEESTMPEEPIKKAIEVEKPKVDQSGQIRKGLGPLPGESPNEDAVYREFRPVPKPGKGK